MLRGYAVTRGLQNNRFKLKSFRAATVSVVLKKNFDNLKKIVQRWLMTKRMFCGRSVKVFLEYDNARKNKMDKNETTKTIKCFN